MCPGENSRHPRDPSQGARRLRIIVRRLSGCRAFVPCIAHWLPWLDGTLIAARSPPVAGIQAFLKK